MLRTALLCSAFSGTLAVTFHTGSKGHGHQPVRSEAFWSCKNGDLRRSGTSTQVGPHSLSTPVWNFRETLGYGAVESTPVIDGNFTTFIASTAGGLFALKRDGSLLWSHRLQGRVMTPALMDGVLYVATNSGHAHAFDAATGTQRWQRQYSTGTGSDAWSVTAAGGTVLVPGGGKSDDGNRVVFALNATEGSQLWRFEPEVAVYNFMPAVVDNSVIFADKSGNLYRLSFRDGQLMWQTHGYEAGSFCTGGIALSSGGQIFATSNREGQGVIHAHSLEDGAVLWMQTFQMEASAAPAVIEGKGGPSIVIGLGKNPGLGHAGLVHHGMLVALDAATGMERWSFEPPVHVGPVAKGVLKGLGAPVGSFSIPDTWSNPAVGADGTVYIGWMGGIVFALDGDSGKELARYNVGFSFQGEPAIAPGYLVVPSIYKVVAFAESSGRPGHHR